MPSGPPDEILNVISKRRNVIKHLLSEVDDRQELVRKVSVSRMTVNRALKELEELNIVASVGSDYWVTPFGRHAYRLHENVIRDYENLGKIQDLLDLLPEDARLDPAILVDAKISRATMSAPQEPQHHLLSLLNTKSTVRFMTPVVDPSMADILYERTIEGRKPAALLLDEKLAEYLWVEQGKRWKDFVSSAVSTVVQIPGRPPYALGMTDDGAVVGFYDGHGSLRGVIENESKEAVFWAGSRLEASFEEGREMVIRSSEVDGITNQAGSSPSSG